MSDANDCPDCGETDRIAGGTECPNCGHVFPEPPAETSEVPVPIDKLYEINDMLTRLAEGFGVRSQFAAGADDAYDEMLDDATHAVAHHFWPDGYPSESDGSPDA